MWEERRERLGRDTLLDRALLKIETLRAGLTTLMMQQLILLGTFFVLPVYLQVVLGLDAFETGKRLFPMSVTMFIAALAGPRLAAGLAPKRVCQAGLLALVVASIVLLGTIDPELDGTTFALALALFGVGAGLLLSQLGNVIMSSVDPAKINEAGGLQGTAQNLGASLGTALIGSVLIAALTTGFVERVEQNPAIPAEVREQVAEAAQKGIPVAPVAEVEQAALDQGVPAEQAQAVAADYGEAQLDGLKRAIGAVAVFALLSLWFTRRLPGRAPPAATRPADELSASTCAHTTAIRMPTPLAAPARSESLITPTIRAIEEPAVLFAADYPFMDVFWTMLIFFFWVIWIWILVTVLIDLFRRHDISGWGKAAWALFVIVLPYLGVFIYLITQGKSMAERRADEIRASRAAFDDQVRSVAASDPGDQIAKAKELLDSGAIDQAEFEQLKRKALA